MLSLKAWRTLNAAFRYRLAKKQPQLPMPTVRRDLVIYVMLCYLFVCVSVGLERTRGNNESRARALCIYIYMYVGGFGNRTTIMVRHSRSAAAACLVLLVLATASADDSGQEDKSSLGFVPRVFILFFLFLSALVFIRDSVVASSYCLHSDRRPREQ